MSLTERFDLLELMDVLLYRDEFLNIASHELKTPLTTLRLHTQVLNRKIRVDEDKAIPSSEVQKLLYHFEDQTKKLNQIVDRMLDFSKIRSNHFLMDKSYISVKEIFEASKEEFPNAKLPSKNPVLLIDRDRIIQVVRELADNARKYSKGTKISLSCNVYEKYVCFKVKDNGIGLPEKILKDIRSPYVRGVPASEVSGMGVGLYISEKILNGHNSSLEVKSCVGKGSTFSFKLLIEPTVSKE